MPSEPSPCLIHMTSAFFPLACRYPLWKLIPARFLWERLSYPEPSRWQEQGLQQAQGQEHQQAQGQGLLQG
jgi:hypothetical protein